MKKICARAFCGPQLFKMLYKALCSDYDTNVVEDADLPKDCHVPDSQAAENQIE